MDAAELAAIIAGLLAPEPAPAFDMLRAGGPVAAYPVEVQPCDAPELGFELEGRTLICGTVDVPENHDNPEGARIAIEFAVLRARSAAPFPDPVVYLHGGPGAGTLSSLTLVEMLFDEHRRTRDIVTFDQRAAGLTARGLRCVESLSDSAGLLLADPDPDADPNGPDMATVNLTQACVDEFEADGVNLAAYNTIMNAHDVRAVVQGLGYDSYNIYGISYGTRLALEVMRTVPDGVRSVVLDSVAPSTVRVYDALYGPHQDTLDAIVAQCAEDAGCAAAFPDFRQQIIDVAAALRTDPIPAGRGPVDVTEDFYLSLFLSRNTPRALPGITAYLPRITAELAARDTTTLDAYLADLEAAGPVPSAAASLATVDLDPDERALAEAALQAAELLASAQGLAATTFQQLQADIGGEGAGRAGVATEFSDSLQDLLITTTDVGARTEILRDLLALQGGAQTRERLFDLVLAHVMPPARRRLIDLVDAMTEAEIAASYAEIIESAELLEGAFLGSFNLLVYACQEDVPFNSRAGAARFNATVGYPFLVDPEDLAPLETIYAACEAFTPSLPRPDFHDPVASDLPVMVLSGLTDTQTSWQWGPLAAQTLTNAQSFVYPGAGHGAILFSDCARDMTVAFLHAPGEAVPSGCIAGLEPDFVLPVDAGAP